MASLSLVKSTQWILFQNIKYTFDAYQNLTLVRTLFSSFVERPIVPPTSTRIAKKTRSISSVSSSVSSLFFAYILFARPVFILENRNYIILFPGKWRLPVHRAVKVHIEHYILLCAVMRTSYERVCIEWVSVKVEKKAYY